MDTKLFNLVKEQKYDELLLLLKNNPSVNININDEFGNFFIEYIIETNNILLIKNILKKEVYLDIIDSNGTTILYNMIKFNKFEILKLIIEKESQNIGISLIDKKDIKGRTALHYCIIFNNSIIFNYLLDNNGDPYVKNNSGENIFFYCLKYNKNSFLITLLKKFNSLNITNNEGENLLQSSITFKNNNIIEYILNNTNINLNNRTKEFGITALHQLVVFNNIEYIKKIINLGADITLTDYLGNNIIHFAMIENNIKISKFLINLNKINLTNTNLNGDTPLHIYLDNNKSNIEYDFLKILIKSTNLNIQNHQGTTPLHYLANINLIEQFNDILINKKLNIFIKDYEGKNVYDIVNNNENIINIVIDSYLNNMKKGEFIVDWEKECHNVLLNKKTKKLKTPNDCKKKIKYTIINDNRSVPKLKEINYDFKSGLVLKDCYFSGFPIDTLFGLLWLKNKNPTISLILGYPLSENTSVLNFYSNMGKDFNYKLDFINCMILWSYQQLFIPSFFDILILNEIKNNATVIIIPIGIETTQGAHTNIIFWDIMNNILERFEPNGKNQPINFDYNPNLLDTVLSNYFNKFLKDINYLKPSDYLPDIGFIMIENLENDKCSKIGDPNGFCTAWCIWYCYQKLLNMDNNSISSEKLVLLLINNLKLDAISFKNLIRDFSKNISEYRDIFLEKVGLDINDWILTNYDSNKLEKLEKLILNLL